MHGYEMIQEIGKRTGGAWNPSPGSVYPTLQLLADEGLVSATEEASGKKLFSLTDHGRADDAAPPWQEINEEFDPVDAQLRNAARLLGSAIEQVAHAGTPDQKAAAIELFNETRRRLYAILGGE